MENTIYCANSDFPHSCHKIHASLQQQQQKASLLGQASWCRLKMKSTASKNRDKTKVEKEGQQNQIEKSNKN
jgi:hypothetical protein